MALGWNEIKDRGVRFSYEAVDLAYRPQPFMSETKRIEFLFELYDRYTRGIWGEGKKKGKK